MLGAVIIGIKLTWLTGAVIETRFFTPLHTMISVIKNNENILISTRQVNRHAVESERDVRYCSSDCRSTKDRVILSAVTK